jgi:hypothetical protein
MAQTEKPLSSIINILFKDKKLNTKRKSQNSWKWLLWKRIDGGEFK